MAIQGIQVIGPQDKVKTRQAHEGGGKKGQMAGALVGGAIGAMGGPGGAVAGASTGAAIGNVVGEGLDPSRAGNQAIERRIQTGGPQIVHSPQSEQLKQSLVAMKAQPPEIQQEYMAPLVKAYMQSVAQDNPAGVA
jgi:uncharacterized protein YcfJ